MRVLTANIAFGIPRADLQIQSLRSIFQFFRWKTIPYLLTKGRLNSIFDYTVHPCAKRVSYFSAHSTLRPVLELIEKENPDVVILNELLAQIHRGPLEEGLRKLGFAHIAWGLSLQAPDLTASTVVASRLPCLEDGFEPTMTQLPQISGGAGIAGLRLSEHPVTIVGAHLTMGLRELSHRQISDLVEIYEREKQKGRIAILAGDFNESAKNLGRMPAFRALGLVSVTEKPTARAGLPEFLRADYDHVLLPPGWHASQTRYVPFGSDHLAVVAELDGHLITS